jgi:hypothetical protein
MKRVAAPFLDRRIPNMDPKHIEALRKTYGGPMSGEEIEFLHDIQGFLDFTIRNGLSFALALGTLSHDVNGLARYGFSLAEAQADHFLPKTNGFAARQADSVGAVEETTE